MRNNVIVNCSDVGIYLNKAKNTKVLYNTLIATTGVDFRFATTTGEADGNVLASQIRGRDGGMFIAKTNLMDVVDFATWYVDPMNGDLRKKGDLSTLLQKGALRVDVTDDYCARARTDPKLDLGALESTLGDCDTTRPPLGGGVIPGDAGADGGTPTDAGGDASASDTGVTSDGGGTDGGVGSDAGAPDEGVTDTGCGCAVPGPRAEGGLATIGLALVLAARRRRRDLTDRT
jgi:MYXO-CTERM domain-containing protein